jgi:hypothetical protein
MSQQLVGIGSAPNDGMGDPARTAFDKLNQNDTELYASVATNTASIALKASTASLAAIATSGSATDLSAGTVATARLGSGTADAFAGLRGDQTYKRVWLSVFKTVDETKTSDSTLNDDAALLFAMLASSTYVFRSLVIFVTTAVADFKWRHNGPASPTLVSITRRNIIAGGTSISQIAEDTAYSAADIALAASAGTGVFWCEGIITNGVNAGNFALRWAQNTLDASNTTVLAGSYIEYMKIN